VTDQVRSRPEVVAHLDDGQVGVVVVSDGGMPEIVHWGASVGPEPFDPALVERPVHIGGLDDDAPLGIVAESSRGWFGRPGLEGARRGGTDAAPRFELRSITASSSAAEFQLVDPVARLALRLDLTLGAGSVLRIGAELCNDGDDQYRLDALRISLPVAERASELVTIGGRHCFEFQRERVPFARSCTTVENRRGKTSHERLGAVITGTVGFGESSGEVWGCHIGWSGSYELVCDAVTDARKVVQLAELIGTDEIVLDPGAHYRAPTVYGAYSPAGLTAMSHAFHAHLRSRPGHPRRPRPVTLNTWQAVYFRQDLDTLVRLADLAASVGVERFVLDDGWFGSRRDATSGLGDWTVSNDVWPNGLAPLIDHVCGLGMEFGIWVEPEMVSPDSDLFRAQPDWVLSDARYPAVLGRGQLVLDVGRPEVRDHLFDQLDALLRDHAVSFVKWDHNRDLVAPTPGNGGLGSHRQTLGTYELLDRLRAAHPAVEFETCASGGGRVDFGILERVDHVWTTDSLDALDQQAIQSGFSLLFPPELMGSHIGSSPDHATGRAHRLGFRAAASVFGTLGIEWNLLEATQDELDQLSEIIAWYRRHRSLLHGGWVIRTDHPDPTVEVHGVVADDRSEAVFAVTRLASGPSHHSAAILIPGLDAGRRYRVTVVDVIGEPLGRAPRQPAWLADGLVATGCQLGTVGVRAPQLLPESSLLLHLATVGERADDRSETEHRPDPDPTRSDPTRPEPTHHEPEEP
jgi:alpha-galactosidase